MHEEDAITIFVSQQPRSHPSPSCQMLINHRLVIDTLTELDAPTHSYHNQIIKLASDLLLVSIPARYNLFS